MKTLNEYIAESKALHQNVNINEKLIINKNFKGVEELEALFDNIDFKYYDIYTLETSDDIFSIMVDYVRDHNIRRFSDFDSYKEASQKDHNACLAVFNKSIKEIDIFQKTSNNTYKNFIIFKTHPHYIFKRIERSPMAMHVLKNVKSWNNTDDVEYYEISKEIFDDMSELYDKLIKK